MYVPREPQKRDEKIRDLIDLCMQSMQNRRLLYDKRRRWFLWGQDSELPARYNRILSHTELVSSFLYSEEHVQFSLSSTELGLGVGDMLEPATTHLQSSLRDAGILGQVSEALTWSLVYDSMFLKMGWNTRRHEVFAQIVDPYAVGVYDEAEGEFDDQQAFCHEYYLSFEDAARRLIRAGKMKDIKRLGRSTERTKERVPTVLTNMIIGATPGHDLQGNIIGQVTPDLRGQTKYASESTHELVRFVELYVWIDTAKNSADHDYAVFTMADPDIVIYDSREAIESLVKLDEAEGNKNPKYKSKVNPFLPGTTPFVSLTPYRIYDYTWGQCHTERLIPLQQWSTERLDQIADLLKQNVDPFRVATGISGLSDEKLASAGGPGDWVYQDDPTGKIEEFRPPIPPDLFVEFNEIGALFEEASGLTKTITGQGTEGVRSKDHARQLATTGSGRIKKVAVGLEAPLSKLSTVAFELLKANDDTRLKTSEGREFVLAQMEGDISVRVAGHSHSPLFADDTKQTADDLYKASVIDKEEYLKMRNPPGVEALTLRLKKRETAEKQAAAQGIPLPGTKEAQERARSHHSPRGDKS